MYHRLLEVQVIKDGNCLKVCCWQLPFDNVATKMCIFISVYIIQAQVVDIIILNSHWLLAKGTTIRYVLYNSSLGVFRINNSY